MLRRKIPKNATGMTRKKTVQCVVIPIYPTRRLTWIFFKRLMNQNTENESPDELNLWISTRGLKISRCVNPECWSSISWQSPKFPVNLSKHPCCHIILPQPYLRIGKCSKVEYVTVCSKVVAWKNPYVFVLDTSVDGNIIPKNPAISANSGPATSPFRSSATIPSERTTGRSLDVL